MKKRTVKYTDDKGEMDGLGRRIKDDLPTPTELAGAIFPQAKVTLSLDLAAIAFFKREARKRKTSYQRMIRNLVRSYASIHEAG